MIQPEFAPLMSAFPPALRLGRDPDKRRLLTALRGGQPDAVPYLDIEVAGPVVDAVLGRRGSPGSGRLAPADAVEFARRAGMDAVYVGYTCPVGRIYKTLDDGSRQYVDGSIKSPAQLVGLDLPPLDATLARLDAVCRAARAGGLGVILGMDSPYKAVKIAVGFQDFLIRIYDDPGFLEQFRDRMTHLLGGAMRRFLELPVDAVLVTGDLCCGSGPMVDPAFLRKFWVGNMLEFLAPARACDLPIILHMDGDFSSILDLLLDSGISALHPFEVTGDLDIYQAKRRLRGRVAVMGNLDCAGVLARGTPKQVREDTLRHLERLAPGGGYVCGSSHEIGADVPFENFKAMVETIHEFGGTQGAVS